MTDGNNPSELGGSGVGFTGVEIFDEIGPPPVKAGVSYEATAGDGQSTSSAAPAEVTPNGQGVFIPPQSEIPNAVKVDMTIMFEGMQGAVYRWQPTDPAASIARLEWHQNVVPPAIPGAMGSDADGQPVPGNVEFVAWVGGEQPAIPPEEPIPPQPQA